MKTKKVTPTPTTLRELHAALTVGTRVVLLKAQGDGLKKRPELYAEMLNRVFEVRTVRKTIAAGTEIVPIDGKPLCSTGFNKSQLNYWVNTDGKASEYTFERSTWTRTMNRGADCELSLTFGFVADETDDTAAVMPDAFAETFGALMANAPMRIVQDDDWAADDSDGFVSLVVLDDADGLDGMTADDVRTAGRFGTWLVGKATDDVAAPCAPTVPTAGGTDSTDVVTLCVFERDGVETDRIVVDPTGRMVRDAGAVSVEDSADDWAEWSDEDDAARAEWEAEEEARLVAEHQEEHTADVRDTLHGDTTPHVREYLARLLHGPKRSYALALYASRVLPLDSFTDPADVVGVTDEMRRNVEKSLGRAMRKDGHKVGACAF